MEVLFLFIGIILGGIIGYLVGKRGYQPIDTTEEKVLQQSLINAERERDILKDRINQSIEKFKQLESELTEKEASILSLNKEVSRFQAENTYLKEKIETQKEEVKKLNEQFKTEFENIASKILKENSREFSQKNAQQIDEILKPFNFRIKEFSDKVQDTYVKGTQERSALKEQILKLTELNQKMSEEAKNLTKALKGDSKKQGNWGELILERILESSGLIKGEEYETQFSTKNQEGKRIQPDVVIYLPEEKHVIIDAKVSLTAYEAYSNAEDDATSDRFLKEHLRSVRKHVDELHEKKYFIGEDINSPDFVLMFVPIESSFSLAIQNDPGLYQYAWDKKIVIVSPTTLLATLRTIASVWKQERLNKNAQEIARQAGNLYDKFVGFIADMEGIEKSINSTSKYFSDAMNKLSNGRGNLIRSTEKIRELGIKNSKSIPDKYLDTDKIDEDDQE